MPFIGQQPITGAYHKLDSITTSATATYNLQLNGGAYYPTSANHLLVSLNGVMQAPQDSFTVSGSQITFASALTSSDNIDFIMALGDVLDIGVPSDGTVNTSQLANSAVTDVKMASTLDLSGKTLTVPSVISRQLIKVYQNYRSANDTANTSTTTYAYGGLVQTITPETANDIFIVDVRMNWYNADNTDGGVRLGLYMKDNVTSTITGSEPDLTNHQFWHPNPQDDMRHPEITMNYVFEAPSTNELEFGYRWKSYAGGPQYPYAYQQIRVTQIINGGSVG